MSKYDFELDLSGNTSTGMILEKIKKGSTVLEFGCATGRMTRYMQQVLDCRVYIVEFEESAFQKAMAYAQDGLCDDIMQYRWVEKFRDVQFDAVIFADVLEHLSRPEDVLRAAAGLLKDDGAIHISVPNITHNDILIKAFRERFDYTKVGLLDDTHIHFWGLENLKQLAADSGMHLQSVEATYCRTGETEQKISLDEDTARLENILRHRQGGEVYQFVVSMTKQEIAEPTLSFRKPTLRMHLYLDTGSNFNEKEVLFFEAEQDGTGGYRGHFQIPKIYNARRIRLDPVEYQGCILTDISVMQEGMSLPLGYTEGVHTEGGICLLGNDPMIFADLQPGDTTIDLRIVLPGPEFERILEENICLQQERLQQLNVDLQSLQASAQAREKVLVRAVEDWQAQFEVAKKEIAMLGRQLDQMRSDLSGYTILYNRKEEYILQLEQRNRELDQALRYRNTLKGLLRGLAHWTLRKMKAVARRILRR